MCVKDATTVVKHVGKLLARIETSSICRQQFANVFADCFCAVHTHQLEFAKLEFTNSSLPCEGRFTLDKHLHDLKIKMNINGKEKKMLKYLRTRSLSVSTFSV